MSTGNTWILIVAFCSLQACKSPQEKLGEKIKANEHILFGDSLKALDDSIAIATVDLYRSYADQFQSDSGSAEYLFKAADLALGIRQPHKALESLELLTVRYPQSGKAASALFMKAFIRETSVNDKEGAKILYKQFIEKYPDHPLHTSAVASFDQLDAGLSDEELIRQFESRQDSLEASTVN